MGSSDKASSDKNGSDISIVIPAKNESKSLEALIPEIYMLYPMAEVIVIDDGSIDDTQEILSSHTNLRAIVHPYSKGNGAAIKAGLRVASRNFVVFMDGDGQHRPSDIAALVARLREGFDMVVGSRDGRGQANLHRSLANRFYNLFSSWMVGHKICDLTSGFRVVDREKALEFISLLPNKFSYPTTLTMCFFRTGHSVDYQPIDVQSRTSGSKSHMNIWRDGIRFLLIIFKIGTLFSPLKIFLPVSMGFFVSGLVYYLGTYIGNGRFTNMGALLLSTSVLVFLMGLISEQITSLIFKE